MWDNDGGRTELSVSRSLTTHADVGVTLSQSLEAGAVVAHAR